MVAFGFFWGWGFGLWPCLFPIFLWLVLTSVSPFVGFVLSVGMVGPLACTLFVVPAEREGRAVCRLVRVRPCFGRPGFLVEPG